MSTATVFSCDADILISTSPVITLYGETFVGEHYTCPAESRAARTPSVLLLVAERDGWAVTSDGRHLCPEQALAETGAVA